MAVVLARVWQITVFPLTNHLLRDILGGTIASFIPFAVFLTFLSARAEQIPLIRDLKAFILQEVRPLFATATIVDLVIISFAAGVAEELCFRGVIQMRWGIVVASLLFGLIHFVTPLYAIFAALLGLYLGLTYDLSGGLLVPIQVHFLYDLGALIYLRYLVKID